MNPVQRMRDVNDIDSSIRKIAMIDSLPTAMLGLGLYGKFTPKADVFHPFLKDSSNIMLLIVIGAIGMAICGTKMLMLFIEKGKIKKSNL